MLLSPLEYINELNKSKARGTKLGVSSTAKTNASAKSR